MTNLGPGSRVLDIGSGRGGHAILMAESFGCFVDGIDLSQNMMETAMGHLNAKPHLKQLIRFEIKDCTRAHYDLIYSRDAIMHIENKRDLFANILKWLKPGGVFLVTDYVGGEDTTKYTNEFKRHLNDRCYHLSTPSEYEELLMKSGFIDVTIDNWNDGFKQALERKLFLLRRKKSDFLSEFTRQDFNELEEAWLIKIKRINDGNQGWILGYGKKPIV